MRRREFITFVGSILVVSPNVAHAQQKRRVPHIGYLMDRSGPPGVLDKGFFDGLREHGYVVGQNIEIEYRWTDGKTERLPALARELVDSKVDIIIVAGADSTKAAKAATTTIPIVMASSQDAVGDGLVASLAHPGGNVTGRSVYAPELTSKRIEILKEMFPTLAKVGVLWNKENAGAAGQLREAEKTGLALGVSIESLPVQIPDGLDEVMARAAQVGAGAILIVSDSSTIGNRAKIGSSALQHHLPTIFANKAYLGGGGLMSYGPDIVESFRSSVVHVDKILKGANPGNLPVEQPTSFEYVINMRTAKALEIAVSPALLARADSLIE
jgi:putative tryptophan/tyrosine transport system substrate-binding protein